MDQQRSEIKLSPKSWHARLINWVFGFSPKDFRNLCPYFWLLIASIILFCLVTPFKLIIKILNWIAGRISGMIEKSTEASFESFIDNLNKGELYCLIIRNNDSSGELRSKYSHMIYVIYDNVEDKLKQAIGGKNWVIWMNKLNRLITDRYKDSIGWQNWTYEFNQEYETVWSRIEKENRVKIENRNHSKKTSQIINEIVEATKTFIVGIVSLLIVFMCFSITAPFVNALTWLWTDIARNYQIYLKILCILVGASFVSFYIGWCIKSLREWYFHKYRKTRIEWIFIIPATPISIIIMIVGWAIRFLFKILIIYILGGILRGLLEGFKEYGGIFADYFDASYSDYCPGINWDEEKEDEK